MISFLKRMEFAPQATRYVESVFASMFRCALGLSPILLRRVAMNHGIIYALRIPGMG